MKATRLLVLIGCCCLYCSGLCGCGASDVEEFVTQLAPSATINDISGSYNRVKLRQSDAADVLAVIHKPEYEMLIRSKNIIASLGQKQKGHNIWFKMVAFNDRRADSIVRRLRTPEYELIAKRKYMFLVNDKPGIFEQPRKNLIFDCEMVLASEVLDEPYANENTRRIAILRQVLKNVCADIDELSSDNKTVDICGMLINQAFESALVKLDSSAMLAAEFDGPNGFRFDHPSLDKGEIRMVVTDDIVTVRVVLGSLKAPTIPNMAPIVELVEVSRIDSADKVGVLRITYKAKDGNNDWLIYKIEFRKVGKASWIELKDQLEVNTFEWDSRAVEDGWYEVKVTASDEISNPPAVSLTGSKISEQVVVDNTRPVIKERFIKSDYGTVTLKLAAFDELSTIGQLHYTVDSSAEWISVVPDDLTFDNAQEDFTVVTEQLQAGEHVIAIRVSDDVGNTTYKAFEVTCPAR